LSEQLLPPSLPKTQNGESHLPGIAKSPAFVLSTFSIAKNLHQHTYNLLTEQHPRHCLTAATPELKLH